MRSDVQIAYGLKSPAIEYLPSAVIFSTIRPAFNMIESTLKTFRWYKLVHFSTIS